MPADAEGTFLPFDLPSIGKKKVTAAFDGGQISSDGGALLVLPQSRNVPFAQS